MTTSYTYWLLRYVPDSIRGEFINIGVLVGREYGDWAVETVQSFARANRLGGDATQAQAWLRDISHMVKLTEDPFAELFLDVPDLKRLRGESVMSQSAVDHMRQRLNNLVQLSDGKPVVASDARTAARRLFDHLVLEKSREERTRSRTEIIRQISSQLDLSPAVTGKILTRTPKVRMGRLVQKFDFALGDQSVKHMTQVLSFTRKNLDVVNRDVLAWSQSVSRLRRNGGMLELNRSGRTLQIPHEVPIRVVHDEPTDEGQREQLEIAREIWADLEVRDYTSTQIDSFVQEASQLVA